MDIQILQSGKVTAIARFIEALIAVFLLSTRLPTAAKLAAKSFSLLSGHLHNPLANFLIFNLIVVVLFLISRQNIAGDFAADGISGEIPGPAEADEREGEVECQRGMTRHRLRRSETDIVRNDKSEDERVISISDWVKRNRSGDDRVISVIDGAKRNKSGDKRVVSVTEKGDTLRNEREKKVERQRGEPRHQMRRPETDIVIKNYNGHERVISVIDGVKRNKSGGKRAVLVNERADTLSNEREKIAACQHGEPRHQLRRPETNIVKKNNSGDQRVISVIDGVKRNKSGDERVVSVIERVETKVEYQRGKPCHQLRRSETDINKNKKCGDERVISVIKKVDTLSNEEFQRTIEEFIAKQQRFLWAQKMAELE